MFNETNNPSIAIFPEGKQFPHLEEFINLETEQVSQALEISQQIAENEDKLTVYNQALGLIAFQDWLQKREPILQIQQTIESCLETSLIADVDAVVNISVGEFKVCLLPTFSFSDDVVNIPQAVVDIPFYAAHFYVIIAIEDELEIATIKGCQRYDQLVRDKANIPLGSDDNYEVPVASFNISGSELLLYLQSLLPESIPLPEVAASSSDYLRDLRQILSQPVINLGQWLQNQVGAVAEELAWKLLPAPSPALRFRPSPAEDLAEILTQIEIDIPAAAVHSYRDVSLANTSLRLYAITWQLPKSSADEDWTVLLILGASQDNQSATGVKLRISDLTMVLDEKELPAEDNYLYSQFIGKYHEKCLVTIVNEDEEEQTSMVFTFELP